MAGGGISAGRLLRLAVLAAVLVAGCAAVAVGPLWVVALVPREAWRPIKVAFLWALLAGYAGAIAAAAGVGLGAAVALRRAARRGERRPRWAAGAILGSAATAAGLLAVEAAAAGFQAWRDRLPATPFGRAADPIRLDAKAGGPGGRPIKVAVIGESSARGEPYHPWLSVGQILGWQIERAFPGRAASVQVLAEGGASLAIAHNQLTKVDGRPDVLVLYAGHNEFQGRYSWMRELPYYDDGADAPRGETLLDHAAPISPLCRLIRDTLELQRIDVAPKQSETRDLVDIPTCTRIEREGIVAEFRRRLDAIARGCRAAGVLAIFVIPPGNDAGFDPDRSVLPASTPGAGRDAFAREFRAARAAESADPAAGVAAYRALLDRQPGFAEAHYRLGLLLRASGDSDGAREHLGRARECDGLPMRCTEDLRAEYHAVARRYPEIILVDGPEVFAAMSPDGIPDDHWLHDGQHPTLLGYIALAESALGQMKARGSLGWPASAAVPRPADPRVAPDAVAAHFGLDRARWAEACRRSAQFYERLAYVRYDPADRLRRLAIWRDAAAAIEAGAEPESLGIPGLGRRPTPRPTDAPATPPPPSLGPPIPPEKRHDAPPKPEALHESEAPR